VRDHHRGQSELLLQLADLDANLVPQLGVEIGERLVEQQDVGLDDERPGERDALLLAAESSRGSRAASPSRRTSRRASATLSSASFGGTFRILSPNATSERR
jgi:hypothetical protein